MMKILSRQLRVGWPLALKSRVMCSSPISETIALEAAKADSGDEMKKMTFKGQAEALNIPTQVHKKAEALYLEHERKQPRSSGDQVDWDKAMEIITKLESAFPEPKVDKEELKRKIKILSPTYNFSKIIEESRTLQVLVDLGVDISKWEENPDGVAMAMSLDLVNDVKPRIQFLTDVGVHPGTMGEVITANPGLFRQDMDELKVRVEYLKWKGFNPKAIAGIVTRCPEWLNIPVMEIDSRLGYFQKGFGLSTSQVQKMVMQKQGASLVIWNGVHMQVEMNKLSMSNDMAFGKHGVKEILLKSPEVFMTNDESVLREIYELLKTMYMNNVILTCPAILSCPILTLKPRHKFLQLVKRDQYDPTKPNFVSPKCFLITSDDKFCKTVAKVPVDLYNKFLLTV